MYAVTDDGAAIIKYLGNPQGAIALVCELVGSELARCMGLKTPDFAVANIPALDLPGQPMLRVEEGAAFFSRWEEAVSLSPKSLVLKNIRHPEDISKLVVLDTWTRNMDRFSSEGARGASIKNFDNVLLRQDKRKVELLVIDHTHAFVETTLEDELDQGWVDEQEVYGLFEQFEPFLTRSWIEDALTAVDQIDLKTIESICSEVPRDWGMTTQLADRLSSCIVDRGRKLRGWLPTALFKQYEMQLVQGEEAQ